MVTVVLVMRTLRAKLFDKEENWDFDFKNSECYEALRLNGMKIMVQVTIQVLKAKRQEMLARRLSQQTGLNYPG